jgi:DNA-directed RNA polymerase I and III subunit RPAC1
MISINKHTNDYLEFTINNSLEISLENSFCNALRRIMIAEVKTYAIEIVSISKNNTILIDGIFSHRLGLVPIKILDPEHFDQHVHIISLDVSYDSNKGDIHGIQNVYSSDLVYDTSMINIVPDILIVKLLKNQQVSIDCIIIEGNGQEHSKWSPVCATTFVENDDNKSKSYTFKIESVGQKKPEQIFIEAIEIMQNKLLCAQTNK